MFLSKLSEEEQKGFLDLVDILNAASEALMRLLQLIVIFIVFSFYDIGVAFMTLFIDFIYTSCYDMIINKHYCVFIPQTDIKGTRLNGKIQIFIRKDFKNGNTNKKFKRR